MPLDERRARNHARTRYNKKIQCDYHKHEEERIEDENEPAFLYRK